MNTRLLSQLAVFALVALVLVSILTAAAAANIVPVTRADDLSLGARTADQIKPSQCTMALTNIVICSGIGICNGTGGNDLFLGTAGDDTGGTRITGGNGADCILGGAGIDDLRGQGGNDIILGGDGDDTINGGAGTDICYGGAGTDIFSNCETIVDP
jgi:Ca2+-binding RTX toxin-like protein